jgi:hypothetical protein
MLKLLSYITICRLKKSLYGLKQSPRPWYKRFDSFMLSHGFKQSNYNGSAIYLLLYVDDMLIAVKNKSKVALSVVNRYMANPGKEHWNAV